MDKIKVNGSDASPVYKFLKVASGDTRSECSWVSCLGCMAALVGKGLPAAGAARLANTSSRHCTALLLHPYHG
jgi:hypothetical protein